MNEADTCTKYVVPKLIEAGWDNPPHSFAEQRSFTDGRIIPLGNKVRRGKQKRADYLLRYTRDFPLAIVEAKAGYKTPAAGLQQAKQYAGILGLSFAYSTNGNGIVEFDFTSGIESNLSSFPSPEELWSRLQTNKGLSDGQARRNWWRARNEKTGELQKRCPASIYGLLILEFFFTLSCPAKNLVENSSVREETCNGHVAG